MFQIQTQQKIKGKVIVRDKIIKEDECDFLIFPNHVASATHTMEK